MAQKRMFCKTITNSARFLKMPVDSQSLYFHLCMNADDDGIVEAYSVLKITGSNEDNLRVLSAKNMIKVLNEDLVSHITDWNTHNLIRADRKVDSIYKSLLLQITPEIELIEPQPRADTGKITVSHGWTSNGQPMDGIGKVRLGKVRLGKDREESINETKTIGLSPLPLKNNDEINNNNDIPEGKEKEKTPTPHSAPPPSPKKFLSPDLETVKKHWQEKHYKSNPRTFFNYYESNGWMVGKNKMKKWEAAAAGWESRNIADSKPNFYKTLNEEKY